MTLTGKAKGVGDLVHLLQRVHRTETRKATEKVAMTDVRNENQHFLVKVRQEKRTEQKGSCQVEADSETSVRTNTKQNCG